METLVRIKTVIPASLLKEFQTYFQGRRSVADGLEVLIHKFLNLTMPGWQKKRVGHFGQIQAHLKPFWPELWTLALDSMSEEAFQQEQAALIRSLEYDIGLYYARHRVLTASKLRAVVAQVGDGPDRRRDREASLARMIRAANQSRSDSRKATIKEARDGKRRATRAASTAKKEASRIRGVLKGLVANGKVKPGDIPVIDNSEDDMPVSGAIDPVVTILMATLDKFDLTPDGDRQAFLAVFGSIVTFMEQADFKDRFTATQYRDYWFGALRDFREGVAIHGKQLAALQA